MAVNTDTPALAKIRAQLSGIRSQLETLMTEAKALDEDHSLGYDLEDICDDIAELEGDD